MENSCTKSKSARCLFRGHEADVRVRVPSLRDAGAVARVHVDTWRKTCQGIIPEEYLENLSRRDGSRWFNPVLSMGNGETFMRIAEDTAGHIIGFAACGPERENDPFYQAEVLSLCVLPLFQRQGVGAELLLSVVKELLARQYSSLLAWVPAENPCRSFYSFLRGREIFDKKKIVGSAGIPFIAYGWKDLTYLKETLRRPSAKSL